MSTLDLWYHERHRQEIALGLRVTKVLSSVQSKFQKVDVFESAGFGRVMTLDGLMMVTERDEFVYHELISHIPLFSHPNPRSVLIIGGGDGGTLREVLRHSCVESAVLCEIDGEVVNAAKDYFPKLSCSFQDPRSKIAIEDGVEFVNNAAESSFDVVIVDSTDPIGPGVGLFSQDFYRAVSRILKPGGIVVAQCESPWEEGIDLAKVYSNLSEVGDVSAFLATIPTYPYGFWSWGIAGRGLNPQIIARQADCLELSHSCLFYNKEVHFSCFALPNFLKKKLKGIVVNA